MYKKKKVLIIGAGSDLAKETIKTLKPNFNLKNILSSKINFKNLDNINKSDFKFDIDHLVFFSSINQPKNFLKYSANEIFAHFNVNFFSIIHILKFFLPKLKKKKNLNKIIFVSSLYADYGRETRLPYSTSKAALKSLCKNLSLEFGKNNINFNCIAPGFVNTKLTRKNLSQMKINKIIKKTPIKRLVKKIEIANTIKFLLSEESNGINGQHIVVDGGISCNGDFSS